MEPVSVARAALLMDRTPQRVRQLLRSGSPEVTGTRVGRDWVVDAASIRSSAPRERPYSPRSAWAVLLKAEPGAALDSLQLSPTELSRARRRLSLDVSQLQRGCSSRGEVHRFWHWDLEAVRNSRLVASGVSAPPYFPAGDNVVSPDEFEGYVLGEAGLQQVTSQLKLRPADKQDHNVLLRVVPDGIDSFQGAPAAPPLAVALDLIDSGEPRSVYAGQMMLKQELPYYSLQDCGASWADVQDAAHSIDERVHPHHLNPPQSHNPSVAVPDQWVLQHMDHRWRSQLLEAVRDGQGDPRASFQQLRSGPGSQGWYWLVPLSAAEQAGIPVCSDLPCFHVEVPAG